MTAEEIIEAYDALVARALWIVNGPPIRFHAWSDGSPTLSIEDDVATVSVPKAESSYDACMLEHETASFPAEMLEWTEERLQTWKREHEELAAQQQRQNEEGAARQRERTERAQLAALKAKYEKPA